MRKSTSSKILICASALFLSACSSNRIPSESSNDALISSKKALVETLSSVVKKEQINTFYAKNVDTQVAYFNSSYNLKTNIFCRRDDATIAKARLLFPPISVGSARINSKNATLKSKVLNIDDVYNTPVDFNTLLLALFTGHVPEIYSYWGDADFSNFAVSITSDDLYELSRTYRGVNIYIYLDGNDFSFVRLKASILGNVLTCQNTDFVTMDGYKVPSKVNIELLAGKERQIAVNLLFSKVEINGPTTMDF